jgi:hypothetical protein
MNGQAQKSQDKKNRKVILGFGIGTIVIFSICCILVIGGIAIFLWSNTSRACPPILKANEQLIFDNVVNVGFIIPSSWIIERQNPGEITIVQSFFSADEARVNGTKCDFSAYQSGMSINELIEFMEQSDDTIVSRKNVNVCGMNNAVIFHTKPQPGEESGTIAGDGDSITIIAETKQQKIVSLMCFGANDTLIEYTVGTLYADTNKP